ncbi:CLUMA_CG000247, isoform A [Clunio marinus]|uniref:CLUMA_CG000247, isoform A n=1 Tax=Clunio marinus TaxID=568069 RepID=A0A1J1HF05_9DIPT|nr:CLUMA_CG000247, isoform A [Clunio marinus]
MKKYHIEGEELERKISTRDLGVIYDHKLNFNDHISYISGKARKMLGFIIRNGKYFKDANTFITLYNSLVRSNIEYASVIWNPYNTQLQTNKLESIQHKFLRFLAFKCLNKKDDSLNYSEIEKRFKMDNLELRRKIADVKFTTKSFNNIMDSQSYLHHFKFSPLNSITRKNDVFKTTGSKTDVGKFSLFNRLMNTFNKLQNNDNWLRNQPNDNSIKYVSRLSTQESSQANNLA